MLSVLVFAFRTPYALSIPARSHYNPSANSRASTSAFFAIFVARCQSPFRMASRAASMNPRIFDAKSACAAFNAFPRVADRFRSAASKLACASAFAVSNSPVESSGTMVGSLGFPAAAGSVAGDAATFGLAGGFRGGPSRAGIGAGSSPRSGASLNAPPPLVTESPDAPAQDSRSAPQAASSPSTRYKPSRISTWAAVEFSACASFAPWDSALGSWPSLRG